ncbi:MAG: phosphotransferase family protein [Caulobacteraceae bacterium]
MSPRRLSGTRLRYFAPEPSLAAFVVRSRLARPGDRQRWTALSGGVSSVIWRVEAGGRVFCVKRALAKLRVKDDWRAPVSRNLYERRWFETAAAIVAGCAPELLAADNDLGVSAMEFLPPERFPLWKTRLLAGDVDPGVAAAVGDRLGRIHAATARRPELAGRFATDSIFHALRLDAYLLAAGERQPTVASALEALVRRTADTRLALVHGDVSPKNILLGPAGPIFLDAETAWWGDPAFDVAFCLNHLLLKHLVVPRARAALAESFHALFAAYRARIDWEEPGETEERAASLLPGLLLARVDGKSPVEYLVTEAQKDKVRAIALPLLHDPPLGLDAMLATFAESLDATAAAGR